MSKKNKNKQKNKLTSQSGINPVVIKPKWQHILLIIVLGCIVYSNSLNGEYFYDDYRVKDSINTSFSISNLRLMTYYTLLMNKILDANNIVYYHLFNLIIHLFTGIIIYLIVHFLIIKENTYIPFYVSALFIVHPLTTESVNYITSRFAQMATLFCFMSLLFLILYIKTNRKIFFIPLLLSFFMGVYSKEIGIAYVIIGLLMYSLYFLQIGSKIVNTSKRNKIFLILAGLVFLLLILRYTGIIGRIAHPYMWKYLLVQNKVILHKYIGLMLLPINLSIDHYVLPLKVFQFNASILISLIFNIGIIIFALFIRKRDKYISFSIIWIYALHIPYFFLTSVVLAVEYRAYPMIFGFVFLVGYTLESIIKKRSLQRIIFICIILGYSVVTISRNKVWQNAISLWSDTLKNNPYSTAALNGRGTAYRKQGIIDRALDDYNRAIGIDPKNITAYNNRGIVYGMKGLYDEAISDFTKIIELNPKYLQAYNSRSNAYKLMGKPNLAKQDEEKAKSLMKRE